MKSCGKLPLAHSDSPKGESLGLSLPLTAAVGGEGVSCAGAAPGQPQEPLTVSAMKARAGTLQGVAPYKATSPLSWSCCPTVAAAAAHPSSARPCLWLSVCLLPQMPCPAHCLPQLALLPLLCLALLM